MRQFLLHTIFAGILGAIIGAIGLFLLAEGLPDGAIMGALLGGSIGVFMGARIHAHRAAIAAAHIDPTEAVRAARLRDEGNDKAPTLERNQLGEIIDRGTAIHGPGNE